MNERLPTYAGERDFLLHRSLYVMGGRQTALSLKLQAGFC
jgi:hypothetical protein